MGVLSASLVVANAMNHGCIVYVRRQVEIVLLRQ
jgi:hypothetical protein